MGSAAQGPSRIVGKYARAGMVAMKLTVIFSFHALEGMFSETSALDLEWMIPHTQFVCSGCLLMAVQDKLMEVHRRSFGSGGSVLPTGWIDSPNTSFSYPHSGVGPLWGPASLSCWPCVGRDVVSREYPS